MSAIAGMNCPTAVGQPLSDASLSSLGGVSSVSSLESLARQQPITTSSSPFLLQEHRLSGGSLSPGCDAATRGSAPSPMQTAASENNIQEKYESDESDKRFIAMHQEGLLERVEQDHDDSNDHVKDTTLEPESDDDLFINEGPSLNDDDDSDQETEDRENNDVFDESSNFVDEDTTYGSPGLREAFNDGYGGGNHEAIDQDASRAGSADNSRKNKRKQFKPRNIVYSMNDEEGEVKERRDSVTGSERDNSPMDLSTVRNQESDSEDTEERQETGDKPKLGGLSVVRPEILFGDNKPMDSDADSNSQPNPLSLLSNLSGFPPGLNLLNNLKSLGESPVKDEFKEMLKLFGVAPDLLNMDNIISKAEPKPSNRENPAFSHPGMLSAALQGTLPPSHQPPTPPRTPQGNKYDDSRQTLPGMIPKMPSLFALQQQMLSGKGQGPMPSLPHVKQQGLPGLPPGMLGVHPMAGLAPSHGMPSLPPHLLAAQRVHGLIPGKPIVTTDYSRYFERFGSSLECRAASCKDMNYREHWHCVIPMCKGKDFAKKEEMIRHSKWHQKMDEALKYGFRRVTPMDDCSDQFVDCSHNKKQTHYHCIQTGCDKTYISTSDVQMHFNYHRKDNAIQREGFLRFRGAEDCNTDYCAYRDQKTTHFHCNRSSCQFTFKNKADMEKHKNYHMKDEQLNKDGFKKFMKHEPCGFLSCKFSRTHNHIHCIRNNCDYVLHSSGQLFSHKRKHERKDNELAYRKYKLAQSMILPGQNNGMFPLSGNPPSSPGEGSLERPPSAGSGSMTSGSSSPPLLPVSEPGKFPFAALPPPDARMIMPQNIPDDVWQQYLLRFDQDEGCGFQECEVEDTEHFHCKDEGCETVFRNEEGVREHGKNHAQQDSISETMYAKVDPDEPGSEDQCPPSCPHRDKEMHYHCKWENCSEIILSTDVPFRRLDHFNIHEYSRKWNISQQKGVQEPISMTMTTNIDAMFKRKRGRPPKNRVIEVFDRNFTGNNSNGAGPQAVFTSFKLPKPGPPSQMTSSADFPGLQGPIPSSSPFNFSMGGRHGMPPSFTSAAFGSQPINPASNLQEAKREACESPTAPAAESEDVQKIQENNNNNQSELEQQNSEEVTPPKNQGLIKARGTYFPLTAFPTSMPQGSVMRRDASPTNNEKSVFEETSPPVSMKSKTGLNFMVSVGRAIESGDNALAKLLQASQEMGFANSDKSESNPSKQEMSGQEMRRQTPSPQILSPAQAQSPRLAQSPLSSLPTSPNVINPAASSSGASLSSLTNPFGSLAGRPFLTSPGLLPPGINPFFPHAGMMLPNPFQRFPGDPRMAGGLFDPSKPFTNLKQAGWPPQKRASPMELDSDDMSLTPDQKKLRLQSSMRMLKDEPVPEGYSRFRFNEDCQFANCNYREHQTHFHCMRKDCNYRFCDKTRFVQHTARHERLDTLCGDEFQGFRGVPCGREDCELNVLHNTSANQKSSSHFHCLKCDYYCTDTNKVVAHRRQHQKLDSILAAGFEKFTPTQYCATPGCSHNGKQTHYHCRKCQYAVLGLSQMEAHKYRHMNE